jgi:hypothetical protein
MSGEFPEQSGEAGSIADAREVAAEDDASGYEYVVYTSKRTGKTVRYEVRPPTVKEIEDARRAATHVKMARGKPIQDGRGVPATEVNIAEYITYQLITAVHAKDADGAMKRVWGPADKDMLMSRRGGKDALITQLSNALMKATRPASVEEEMGNSDASPSDASS